LSGLLIYIVLGRHFIRGLLAGPVKEYDSIVWQLPFCLDIMLCSTPSSGGNPALHRHSVLLNPMPPSLARILLGTEQALSLPYGNYRQIRPRTGKQMEFSADHGKQGMSVLRIPIFSLGPHPGKTSVS